MATTDESGSSSRGSNPLISTKKTATKISSDGCRKVQAGINNALTDYTKVIILIGIKKYAPVAKLDEPPYT